MIIKKPIPPEVPVTTACLFLVWWSQNWYGGMMTQDVPKAHDDHDHFTHRDRRRGKDEAHISKRAPNIWFKDIHETCKHAHERTAKATKNDHNFGRWHLSGGVVVTTRAFVPQNIIPLRSPHFTTMTRECPVTLQNVIPREGVPDPWQDQSMRHSVVISMSLFLFSTQQSSRKYRRQGIKNS